MSSERASERTGRTASRNRIRDILVAAGLSDRPDSQNSSIHSWRCEHPDRYGPCTCLDDLVNDLTTVVTDTATIHRAGPTY